MIVLKSMSDIRTKLLLGTSLASIAMIFVMAAGVDAFDTKSSTAVESAGLNGHVTVMAIHPDGSASYAQADNLIVQASLTTAANQLFDSASGTDEFDCIRIGEGAGTGNDINDPMNAAATAQPQCDPNGANNTGGAGIDEIEVDFTILAGDLVAGTVTISEAVLENGAGVVISHVPLDADVPAVENTIVTIIYTMTLSG